MRWRLQRFVILKKNVEPWKWMKSPEERFYPEKQRSQDLKIVKE